MARHYLLDGYNIVKQVPLWANKSLQEGREALVRWINTQRPHGSSNNSVTVVFDGNDEAFGGAGVVGDVRVLFSHGSADDMIKRMMEKVSNRNAWTVVSNDKDIILYVRALGTSVLSVAEFTALINPVLKVGQGGAHKASQQPGEKEKYISLQDQALINKELAKRWIKGQ